jgi:hypothetical protein
MLPWSPHRLLLVRQTSQYITLMSVIDLCPEARPLMSEEWHVMLVLVALLDYMILFSCMYRISDLQW